MRAPHHLVRSPSGIFHFRLKVPLAIQALWGLRVVKLSLRTSVLKLAQWQALALAARYAQAFEAAKVGSMSKPPSVDDIVAGFHSHGRKYDVEFDPTTGRPTRIKTDGTPQDNAAALDMARVVFAQPLPAPLTAPTKRASMTLGKAIEIYTTTEAPGLKPGTWDARQRAFACFAETISPETPVGDIDRRQAAAWANQEMSQGRTKRTMGNYVSHVAQLFTMLQARGEVESNPVKGVVVMSKKEKLQRKAAGHAWEPFELDTLKTVFDPANYTKLNTAHSRWAPLIGLYTGARVSEIAQLFLRDFVTLDGQPCVRITHESDGQSLKTEASQRLVPLHPVLIELGLLEYRDLVKKDKHDRLFPFMRIDSAAGQGNSISKAWSYYLRQLGVAPRRANARVGFHSLRKNVVQVLQGPVLAERRRAFVGHEPGDQDVHTTDYMRPWTACELQTLFPALNWGDWLDVAALRAHLWSPVRGEREN